MKKISALILSFLPKIRFADEEKSSIILENHIEAPEFQVLSNDVELLLKNYLDWHYKNLKNNNSNYIDNLHILITNKDLIEFKKAKLNWSYNWQNKLNEEVLSYSIYLDLNDFKNQGNYILMNVTYGEDLVTKSNPEVVQQIRNQNHKLVIKNENGILTIVNDYYNDEFLNENFDISEDEFFNSLEDNISNSRLKGATLYLRNKLNFIDTHYKRYKSNLDASKRASESLSPKRYSKYNGDAAANYAVQYALSYNSNYTNWTNEGGDCTNFVSQCLLAGGIHTDAAWYKDSNKWLRVVELHDWLTRRKDYARSLTWQENATAGDIVQLYTSEKGWYHSLIISCNRNNSGELFISSHSGDWRNRALSNYTQTKRFLILTS
ncbi:MAG: amidase domain-containing protein [Clostridium sp.]|uniref:amidase domain-containing protein n=1 Tax=Clostridium sp. TaxID=1506 RepID=UPI00321713A6